MTHSSKIAANVLFFFFVLFLEMINSRRLPQQWQYPSSWSSSLSVKCRWIVSGSNKLPFFFYWDRLQSIDDRRHTCANGRKIASVKQQGRKFQFIRNICHLVFIYWNVRSLPSKVYLKPKYRIPNGIQFSQVTCGQTSFEIRHRKPTTTASSFSTE